MHALVHLQDKADASEDVLVVDFDNLTCVAAVVSNVSEWGCRLTSDDAAELRKNIGIRVGESGTLVKAQVTAVKGAHASVVFLKNDKSVVDKRRERRSNVSIPVTLKDKDGTTMVSGLIVDAGANGCRVSATGLAALPDEVMLTIKKFDRPVLGEFVWRNDSSAGLRLVWDTQDMSDIASDDNVAV